MNTNDEERQPDNHVSLDDVVGWGRFACWTTILLFPVLYFINGPSVSPDQYVVRASLLVLAVVGAVLLQIVSWRRQKMSR